MKGKYVKSSTIYSPQAFVEAVTGHCFCFAHEDTVREIEEKLERYFGQSLWNYPLTEIDHIVENDLKVVLVDVSGFYGDMEMIQKFRWFEVPDDFEEDT